MEVLPSILFNKSHESKLHFVVVSSFKLDIIVPLSLSEWVLEYGVMACHVMLNRVVKLGNEISFIIWEMMLTHPVLGGFSSLHKTSIGQHACLATFQVI